MISETPKILIIDDDLINIIVLEKALDGLDVEFIRAMSGEEAIEQIRDTKLALALVDVHMPGKNGYDTVHEIRRMEGFGDLPVIFFSGVYSENYYAVNGLDTGAVDFIVKPVIPEVLKSKVKVFLELYRQKSRQENLIQQLENSNENLRKEVEYRKLAEQRLIKAKEKAEESERLKTAFLANMSHEVRTPMNAIVGFTDLLQDNDMDEIQKKEFIQIIKENSNILLNLLDDIIDIAKIEAGQLRIRMEPCKVKDVLNESFRFFKEYRHKLKKEHLDIRLNYQLDDPELCIKTDENRFRQILNNLIENAIKYTHEGFVEIGVKKQKDDKLVFYVRDTGIGIPEDKVELIFKRFTQVDLSSTRAYGGTGLGLAISKNIVRLLGGRMWVESKDKEETIFYFSLPMNQTQAKVEKRKKYPCQQSNDWQDKKILIVEDNQSNFRLAEAALRKTRANLIWAKDGREAINICHEQQDLDAVLMDIRLPEMNGYEATKIIKQNRKDLIIIAQTAYAAEEDKEKALAQGFDAYLSKPIKACEFIEVLSGFFENQG